MSYDTIFISDVHLGTDRCDIDKFLNFLDTIKTKKLIMIGDIIDIYCLEKYNTNWYSKHTQAIHKLIELSKSGVEIIYILGNHEATARRYFQKKELKIGNITVCNHHIHIDKNYRKFLCIHGDQCSQCSSGSWKQYFLNMGYETVTPLNNFLRKNFNISLVNFLKNTKRGEEYINIFENDVINYVKKTGYYHGVICGHIHHLNSREINKLTYMCCGDWVDTCSYITELDGNYALLNHE